ncbi:MAG: F0F1 ATP synthase subunit delta [Candidatus Competibacteraceae bacterium]|nr:F0F1 ATP synthase subunit delta [Candidatus Competibacteraceae bacterium]
MAIDWTTFTLEIINFLVLVWILKRFLYQPVLETLARRRAGIERTLAEARDTETGARALQTQFENRLADWEQEKVALRARFEQELTVERSRQMQALADALVEEQERRAAQDANRQEGLRLELESQALEQARRFATALLARLAGPELEARLVEAGMEDFAALPADPLNGITAAARTPGARVRVDSAFPLSEEQQKHIGATLAARLGISPDLDFRVDPTLRAGLRLALGPWQMNFSLADELAQFAAATHHAD